MMDEMREKLKALVKKWAKEPPANDDYVDYAEHR